MVGRTWLGVLVLVVMGGLVAGCGSPGVASPLSSTKTFTDEEHGFAVKYDSSYLQVNGDSSSPELTHLTSVLRGKATTVAQVFPNGAAGGRTLPSQIISVSPSSHTEAWQLDATAEAKRLDYEYRGIAAEVTVVQVGVSLPSYTPTRRRRRLATRSPIGVPRCTDPSGTTTSTPP